ncbi:phage DNA packaging protein J [Streptomyces albidoflavus]
MCHAQKREVHRTGRSEPLSGTRGKRGSELLTSSPGHPQCQALDL